jgi:hypothetical protein
VWPSVDNSLIPSLFIFTSLSADHPFIVLSPCRRLCKSSFCQLWSFGNAAGKFVAGTILVTYSP